MPHIEAVLFDFDDTLIDWSRQANNRGEIYRRHVYRVHDYLQAAGHALPDKPDFFDQYLATIIAAWQEAKQTWAGVEFAATMRQTLLRAGLDPAQIDLRAVMEAFAWEPVPQVVLYPDTVETLTAVKNHGYRLGLITNSMMPMWMRDIELEAYGLLHYFDARVTSGDLGYMKPHPRIYHHVLAQLDVPPEHALFVGDRPENDIAGANEVGLVSVMMNPPHLNYKLKDVQPHFTIEKLSELLPILEQFEG